jgi:hypothetical protein
MSRYCTGTSSAGTAQLVLGDDGSGAGLPGRQQSAVYNPWGL